MLFLENREAKKFERTVSLEISGHFANEVRHHHLKNKKDGAASWF